MGSDGSTPLSGQPLVYLGGVTATWHTNKGSGGGFTENGFQILADNNELRLGNRINGNVNAFVNWNIYDGNVQDANIQIIADGFTGFHIVVRF